MHVKLLYMIRVMITLLLAAEPPTPVITVCEIYANWPSYRDKPVAVVGRHIRPTSPLVTTEYLVEEHCRFAPTENAGTARIQVQHDGFQPRLNRPAINEDELNRKFTQVQKTTPADHYALKHGILLVDKQCSPQTGCRGYAPLLLAAPNQALRLLPKQK